MFIYIKPILLVLGSCLVVLAGYAQSTKPRIYIDPQGKRYTKQQFDSVKIANMGKPIAQKDIIEKETETQITFEILSIDPLQEFKQKWIGKPLPDFSLNDLQNNKLAKSLLQGKIVIINFWSTTCGPCLKEMPSLSKLADKYANQDLVFLAFPPESAVNIQKVLSKRKFTYLVVPQAQALFSALGIKSYPFHFIVDRAGFIQDIYSGAMVNSKTNESVLDTRLVSAIEKASAK